VYPPAAAAAPGGIVPHGVGSASKVSAVLLNRSVATQMVAVSWHGAGFRYMETADPRQENSVEPAPKATADRVEVQVPPGAIVTLTNVELAKVSEDFYRA